MILRRGRPFALVLALAALPASAEVVEYPLELPSGVAAFRIPFQVVHAGTVLVEASWTGGRVLSLRVEDPSGATPVVRLSGPSPQRLRFEIADTASGAVPRLLLVRSLDARSTGHGTVTLTLPDDPAVVRARAEASKPKPKPKPPPDPWTLAAAPPPGATPEVGRAFDAVEGFRRLVIAPDGARRPDACGWQDDLLRQLSGWRDGSRPDPAAVALLEGIGAGVAHVEDLRLSQDPILAGPTPEPGLRQRAWTSLREQRLRPLHADLDALTEHATRGLPASLEGATWPARMVACLVAAERQVEASLAERAPKDAPAPGPVQHAPIVAAAEAFRALTGPRP